MPGSLHNQGLEAVHQRFRAAENGLEHPSYNDEKDQRSGDRMQENRIQTPGPNGWSGCAIGCARADVMRPLPAAGNVLQNWKLYARGCQRRGSSRSPFHELEDFFDALAFRGADQRNRRTQLGSPVRRYLLAATTALQIVRHVQDGERRQLQAQDSGASQHPECRPRLVQSRISKSESGLGMPAMVPASTSRVTCSSSERGFRL